jgi:hypothetical protein
VVYDSLNDLASDPNVHVFPLPRERPDLLLLMGVLMPDGSRWLFMTERTLGDRVAAFLRSAVPLPREFARTTLGAWIQVRSNFALDYLAFKHFMGEFGWADFGALANPFQPPKWMWMRHTTDWL